MSFETGYSPQVRSAKLHVLAESQGLGTESTLVPFGDGSVLLNRGTIAALAGREYFGLGEILLLASQHNIQEATLFYDDDFQAALAARRVQALRPGIDIRVVCGRESSRAVSAPVLIAGSDSPMPDGFTELCSRCDVKPVFEHGVWRGEVLGLEVVRVSNSDFRVGIGQLDQETSALLYADHPVSERLVAAVAEVRKHRYRGVTGTHPLTILARERWLRTDLVADPSQVGLAELVSVEPAVERLDLRSSVPAPAVGTSEDGESVLVVCSVGVDVELVPSVADLVLRERPDRVVIALPARDVLPSVERTISWLSVPVKILGLEVSWL